MPNPLRHNEALTRPEGHDAARRDVVRAGLEIDQEGAFEDKEKLVVLGVLVLMVLALHHSETNHGLVDPPQCLIGPPVCTAAIRGSSAIVVSSSLGRCNDRYAAARSVSRMRSPSIYGESFRLSGATFRRAEAML
jgi:hypothetical protein